MLNNLVKHLKTIHIHRKFVCQSCFKMGIVWQGLIHDLSKYSLKELSIAKYYSGKRSPHAEARDKLGYSPSWLNHYHKNKHHWQYWLDMEDWPDSVAPIKMPYKYVIEMFCDFIGAGKAYNIGQWTTQMPLDYWNKACKGKRLMHKDSERLLELLLGTLYALNSEEAFYDWYKNNKQYLKRAYELEVS